MNGWEDAAAMCVAHTGKSYCEYSRSVFFVQIPTRLWFIYLSLSPYMVVKAVYVPLKYWWCFFCTFFQRCRTFTVHLQCEELHRIKWAIVFMRFCWPGKACTNAKGAFHFQRSPIWNPHTTELRCIEIEFFCTKKWNIREKNVCHGYNKECVNSLHFQLTRSSKSNSKKHFHMDHNLPMLDKSSDGDTEQIFCPVENWIWLGSVQVKIQERNH